MRPEDLSQQLDRMKARYRDIENQLSDPRVYANQFQCRTLTRERGRLSDSSVFIKSGRTRSGKAPKTMNCFSPNRMRPSVK